MLTYALIVFAVAALGGLVLASSVLRGKLAPWAISILHALLGASGLVLLIVTVLQGQGAGRVTAALGILVVAALGGFYLASLHLRKQVAPKAVVFVHAGVAVVGFLTLLSAVLAISHAQQETSRDRPPQPPASGAGSLTGRLQVSGHHRRRGKPV